LRRPFRMWLYPLPALLAFVGWMYLLLTTDRVLLGYGMAVLFAGSLVFLVWSWLARSWPFAAAKDT